MSFYPSLPLITLLLFNSFAILLLLHFDPVCVPPLNNVLNVSVFCNTYIETLQ